MAQIGVFIVALFSNSELNYQIKYIRIDLNFKRTFPAIL